MLIKKYEEVVVKTAHERLLEAQRAKVQVKDNTLEGEVKCQKKPKMAKKAKQKK